MKCRCKCCENMCRGGRLKEGGIYYYIKSDMEIDDINDLRVCLSNKHWDTGNYFTSYCDAKRKRDEILEVLRRR